MRPCIRIIPERRATIRQMKYTAAVVSDKIIRLEYAAISGKKQGPTVTITAGMDGDEYVGIETAQKLYDRYAPSLLSGRITILPLINEAGYWAHISRSPIDEKYPKYTFPGSKNGTHTEQLVHWLYETHIKQSDVWIDLHGGSTEEKLNPFVWLYKSRHEDLKLRQSTFIKYTRAPVVVYDRNPFMNYSVFLDIHHIQYVLMEYGQLGNHLEKNDDTPMRWIDDVLHAYDMLAPTPSTCTFPNVYTSVHYVYAPHDGFWRSNIKSKLHLGTLTVPNFKSEQIIEGRNNALLWKYIGPYCYRGDILAAYAISD